MLDGTKEELAEVERIMAENAALKAEVQKLKLLVYRHQNGCGVLPCPEGVACVKCARNPRGSEAVDLELGVPGGKRMEALKPTVEPPFFQKQGPQMEPPPLASAKGMVELTDADLFLLWANQS